MTTLPGLTVAIFWFLLLLSGFCERAVASQKPREPFELKRSTAIALAIRNNIDLRVRAIDTSLAETELAGSRSIYDPNLTAALNFDRTHFAGERFGTEGSSAALGLTQTLSTGGSVTVGTRVGPTRSANDPDFDYTDWSSSVGVTVVQPLLKNAGREATELGISLSSSNFAGSVEQFRFYLIDTVFAVVTAYNGLYVQRQLLETRKAALSSAQQLLNELKRGVGPNAKRSIDIANTEYVMSQRQTEVVEATRQVSSKEAGLRYLIGMPDNVHIVPLDPPAATEPAESEKEAIALAIAQRADLKELRLQQQANGLSERVSARNLWPDLSLTASGGYRGYSQDGSFSDSISQLGDGMGSYWAAGLQLSVPLGNTAARSEHRRDQLRGEQLQHQITATEWKIRDTIEEDNRSLISTRLKLRETAKSRQLAEDRVAQYRVNARRGTATVKDLLDAENDLIFARNLELSVIETFAYQVALLWRDMGVLLERLDIHVDAERPDLMTAAPLPADSRQDRPTPLPAADADPAAVTVTSTAAGGFTLTFAELTASELPGARARVERAGLTATASTGHPREQEVFRLCLGDFADRQGAQQQLDRLRGLSAGGFVLNVAPRSYRAYAGSFFTRQSAEQERKRLAAKGIAVTIQTAKVKLSTVTLAEGG